MDSRYQPPTMVQEESLYLPDFSDIYDDSFQFWDFMNNQQSSSFHEEKEIILENENKDEMPFWDFLSKSTVTENVTQGLPSSDNFDDVLYVSGDKLKEETHYSNIHDNARTQKNSTSNEFWDFLNSSTEDSNNSGTDNLSSLTKNQLGCDVASISNCAPTSNIIKESALPRISSVFSIPINSVKNSESDSRTIKNDGMSNSVLTHNHPINLEHFVTQQESITIANTNKRVSHSVMSHDNTMNVEYNTEPNDHVIFTKIEPNDNLQTIHPAVANNNPMNIEYNIQPQYPLISSAKTETKDFTSKQEKCFSVPISTLDGKSLPVFETCNLQDISSKKNIILENKSNETSAMMPINGPTYLNVVQKPIYSQYLIIVNNPAPPFQQQKPLKTNQDTLNHKQQARDLNGLQTSSEDQARDDGFQNDLHLAGFRNNHVLNVYKNKKKSVFNTNDLESDAVPVSTAPLDGDTLNSIKSRIKYKQSCSTTSKLTEKKCDSGRGKPIKCISLGRRKNAIQQTDTPISMEEDFVTDSQPESCRESDSSLNKSLKSTTCNAFPVKPPPIQKNSLLPITFTLPMAHPLTDLAKKPQTTRVSEGPGVLLMSTRPLNASRVFVLQEETRPKNIILPKPPYLTLRKKEEVPKTKKCGRKTVKELLQERQQSMPGKQNALVPEKQRQTNENLSILVFSPETFQCDSETTTPSISSKAESVFSNVPNEKSLRPRHYDMSELQIGLLKVQEDEDSCRRFRSKFKVLFLKRQFIYDFPVCRCNQPSLKSYEEWSDAMVKITVPFNTITSISLKDRLIYLDVDRAPNLLSLGHSFEDKSSYWRHFIQNSFSHKVVLRKRQASKLKAILCEFDERFIALTAIMPRKNQLPFEGVQPSPILFKKRFSKNRKCQLKRLQQVGEEESPLLVNQICSCRTNCRSIRCSCVKAARSCNSAACLCTNCNNPLNVLEMIGLDITFSLKDICLFHNIYQIPDLLTYLSREVRLDCCKCVVRVQDCIPGTVICFNCNALLEYSWCHSMVSYPELNPRNHCSFCGQCCFSNGRHCHVCKKCYEVTSKSSNCPTCVEDNLACFPRSLNTFCYDKNLHRPSTKPQIILLDSSSLRKPLENALPLPDASSAKSTC